MPIRLPYEGPIPWYVPSIYWSPLGVAWYSHGISMVSSRTSRVASLVLGNPRPVGVPEDIFHGIPPTKGFPSKFILLYWDSQGIYSNQFQVGFISKPTHQQTKWY